MSTVPSSYISQFPIAPALRLYEEEQDQRLDQLLMHGTFSMSYHTLQEGLNYFETAGGYIAYEKKWGYTFVLADPVVAPERSQEAIEEFLKHHKRVSFCQISEPVAKHLHACGYYVNEMGTEFEIDLASYQISGKKKRHIKEATNRLRNLGMEVVELSSREVDQAELESISESWRGGKVVKETETRFLSRGIVFEDEPDVRKFYLRDTDGKIVAYIYFDPVYRNGEVVGYLSNSKRHQADAPRDFDFAMTWHAIQQFREEGKETLYLGMAPFYELEDQNPSFKPNRITNFCLRTVYEYSRNRFMNFKGMAAHKRRYRGESSKVYYASQARSNFLRLLTLARVCNMC